MAIFSCRNCGLAITVAAGEMDKEVTCSACKTQQRVSADTRPNPATTAQPHFGRLAEQGRGETRVPDYVMATLIVTILHLVGILVILFGVGECFNSRTFAVGLITSSSGIMAIAVAQILNFARQIARQTYNSSLDA